MPIRILITLIPMLLISMVSCASDIPDESPASREADQSSQERGPMEPPAEGSFESEPVTGADVNAGDDEGRNALMRAIESRSSLATVEALLDEETDIDAQTQYGMTALMMAASGRIEIVQALLDAGADVNVKADDGLTALMAAAGAGRNESVQALLEAGADVDAKSTHGLNALIVAVSNGHVETVKTLLDAGAEVNAKANDGLTALRAAQRNGQVEIAELLKDAGAAE